MQCTGYPASIDFRCIMLETERRQIIIIDDNAFDKLTTKCHPRRLSFHTERSLVSKIGYEHPLRMLRSCHSGKRRKTAATRLRAVRPLIRVYTDVKLPQVDRGQIPEICALLDVDQGGTRFPMKFPETFPPASTWADTVACVACIALHSTFCTFQVISITINRSITYLLFPILFRKESVYLHKIKIK